MKPAGLQASKWWDAIVTDNLLILGVVLEVLISSIHFKECKHVECRRALRPQAASCLSTDEEQTNWPARYIQQCGCPACVCIHCHNNYSYLYYLIFRRCCSYLEEARESMLLVWRALMLLSMKQQALCLIAITTKSYMAQTPQRLCIVARQSITKVNHLEKVLLGSRHELLPPIVGNSVKASPHFWTFMLQKTNQAVCCGNVLMYVV